MQTHPAVREIIDLHDFFQAWLTASLPDEEAVFARFTRVTAPDFTLISPDGQPLDSAAVAAWIRAAHGSRPGFQLWTTDHTVCYEDGRCVLATYLEWQRHNGTTTCRISSVLFHTDAGAPHGLLWQHVHETWRTAG